MVDKLKERLVHLDLEVGETVKNILISFFTKYQICFLSKNEDLFPVLFKK